VGNVSKNAYAKFHCALLHVKNWFQEQEEQQQLEWLFGTRLLGPKRYRERMWTARFNDSWRKMKVVTQDRAWWREAVCGRCSTGSNKTYVKSQTVVWTLSITRKSPVNSHFFIKRSFRLADFIEKLVSVEESRLGINVQHDVAVNHTVHKVDTEINIQSGSWCTMSINTHFVA